MIILKSEVLRKITCIKERGPTHDSCIFTALPCPALKIKIYQAIKYIHKHDKVQHSYRSIIIPSAISKPSRHKRRSNNFLSTIIISFVRMNKALMADMMPGLTFDRGNVS